MLKIKRLFGLAFLTWCCVANAGFGEATSALQLKNPDKVVQEVKAAIQNNQYEDISFFLNTLESRFYQDRDKNSYVEFLSASHRAELTKTLKQISRVTLDNDLKATLDSVLNELAGVPPAAPPTKNIKNYEAVYPGFGIAFYQAVKNQKEFNDKLFAFKANVLEGYKLGYPDAELSYARLLLGYSPTIDYFNLEEKDVKNARRYEKAFRQTLVKTNKKTGYEILTKLISTTENTLARCLMGDIYATGNYVKKDNKEALRWYMSAHLLGEEAKGYSVRLNDCGKDKIEGLYLSGKSINYDQDLHQKIRRNAEKLPSALQFIDYPKPRFIKPLDAKVLSLPILEIHENNPNYVLMLYADGSLSYNSLNFISEIIEYSNYRRLNEASLSAIIGKKQWKIAANEATALIAELSQLGIDNWPFQKSESLLCDTGEIGVYSIITLRKGRYRKVLNFQNFMRHENEKYPELAAILATVEKHIPTKQWRCGEERLDKDYLACIAKEDKNNEKARIWMESNLPK